MKAFFLLFLFSLLLTLVVAGHPSRLRLKLSVVQQPSAALIHQTSDMEEELSGSTPGSGDSPFVQRFSLARPQKPSGSQVVLPQFCSSIDAETREALKRFRAGKQGNSVKGISEHVKDHTISEIHHYIGSLDSGWSEHPEASGEFFTIGGHWRRKLSEGKIRNGQTYPIIFYVHTDGGVVKIKPRGAISRYERERIPQASIYVKKNPHMGEDLYNEAFKVYLDYPLPKRRLEIKLPSGMKKVYGSPDFEEFIKSTGWEEMTHFYIKVEKKIIPHHSSSPPHTHGIHKKEGNQ